jgi:hypothetical protein
MVWLPVVFLLVDCYTLFMRLTQASDRLTLQDSPGCFWILSLLFLTVGVITTTGPLGLFTDAAELAPWEQAIMVGLGLVAVGAGVFNFLVSMPTFTTFDRSSGQVRIRELGRAVRQVPFTEIAGVGICHAQDSEGGDVYRLQLQLQDGEQVPLSKLWMAGQEEHERVAGVIRTFLHLPASEMILSGQAQIGL